MVGVGSLFQRTKNYATSHNTNTLLGFTKPIDLLNISEKRSVWDAFLTLQGAIFAFVNTILCLIVYHCLYYFGRDFDSIYRWLTYAWAVSHINDPLLSAFWEELYAAGYEMRKMDNPDVPPIYRHKDKNSPRIEKVDGITYPQSTYGPVIRVRRQFYQRMLRVAEKYGQEADAAWLREEMAKIG